jgi:hypothetical protein
LMPIVVHVTLVFNQKDVKYLHLIHQQYFSDV